MKRRNYAIIIILVMIFIVMIAIDKKNSCESNNINKMVDKAEYFYEKGDLDKAITQLHIYLKDRKSDINNWIRLAGYYNEIDSEKDAFECYVNAEKYYEGDELKNTNNNLVTLYSSNPIVKVKEDFKDLNVIIEPIVEETKNLKIVIQKENLFNGNSNKGYIINSKDELVDGEYLTTDWFSIDDSGESSQITMSGGFNCAIWQFKDENKKIISTIKQENIFRDKDICTINNRHISTVKIPAGAKSARVTYIDYSIKPTSSTLEDELYIVYGGIPQMAQSKDCVEIEVPDLKEGSSIIYENSKWYLKEGNTETELENYNEIVIKKGYTISLVGDLCGKVTIEDKSIEERSLRGEYGVRWKINSTENVCERVGDSSGLSFNYLINENWAGDYINDFDYIYPWSDIKLCSIDKEGNIIYSDEEGFRNDGSSGDVMVEIPKHYVKREIIDEYEYIWISGEEKEGYEIDPSFVTPNGIVDKIYVGAYLSGITENQDNINSVSGENPLINISLENINEIIDLKGNGWQEIDITTLMTIQRLFLIETAVKDSQALFDGPTNMVWGTTNSKVTSVYAYSSSNGVTNKIQLKDNDSSKRFKVGDAITIIQVPNEYADAMNEQSIKSDYYSYYSILSKYENNNKWNRKIESISSNNDGTIWIEFSGDPIEVVSYQTMIMHLPKINGETDVIKYHTGTLKGDIGLKSFKYRNIENLWGNVSVLLEGVTVNSGNLNVNYPNNKKVTLSYQLPIQEKTPANNALGSVSMILSMGFDLNNPFIMLPSVIGNGQSSPVNSFGDALFYSNYNNELCLAYGFTWDLRQYAGLFSYRTIAKSTKAIEYGSRIVYR